MALRKVNEGSEVRWPNGQIRAKAGEVFDDMLDVQPATAAAYMAVLAARAKLARCTVAAAAEDGEAAQHPLPLDVARVLERHGWGAVPEEAPEPVAAPARKARRKAKKATEAE